MNTKESVHIFVNNLISRINPAENIFIYLSIYLNEQVESLTKKAIIQ